LPLRLLNNLFCSPKYQWFWVVLLFIPLLFISNRSSHDWGDDFAQYIHQAKNIVQGIPQSQTGYIFNPENKDIGPKAYPVGFPMFLAPVYALFGLNMKAYTVFITLIYFALGLLLVKFFQRYFSFIASAALAAIFLYNPQMLIFKQEVMSDLPFTLLLVTALLLYEPEKEFTWLRIVMFSLVTGLMISVRPIGFVFLAAIIIDITWKLFGKKNVLGSGNMKGGIITLFVWALTPVLIYFLLNILIFRIPSGGSLSNYLAFFSFSSFISTFSANLEHYTEVFRYIYTPGAGITRGIALICGFFVVVMTLTGIIKKVSDKSEAVDIFFIFYMLVLMVYPNNFSAFRFMVPVDFLLLMYAAQGIKSVMVFPRVSGKIKAMVLSSLLLIMFLPGIAGVIKGRNTTLAGPQEQSAIEAFTHIRDSLPENAVLMFAKPRALSLYAERSAFADPIIKDMTKFHEQVVAAGVNYFLLSNKISSEESKRYMRVMGDRVEKVWSNDVFELYRLKNFNP
jgi:4-amino-4-deoxy-L-arabinose transferase-like glycosyltransferase